MVNLKSASFAVIMLLHEGLTHIHSKRKSRSHFGEFHLPPLAVSWPLLWLLTMLIGWAGLTSCCSNHRGKPLNLNSSEKDEYISIPLLHCVGPELIMNSAILPLANHPAKTLPLYTGINEWIHFFPNYQVVIKEDVRTQFLLKKSLLSSLLSPLPTLSPFHGNLWQKSV